MVSLAIPFSCVQPKTSPGVTLILMP
uniref:Uncharacterized protein n=1 Tax=Anguilla anguilla TaxID=7936 RepID=A0A0E9XPI0_ANGAN